MGLVIAFVMLLVTLALRKNMKHSKTFAVFYTISLLSISVVLMSILVIGGWEGMGIGIIAGPISIIAFIGMLITLVCLKNKKS